MRKRIVRSLVAAIVLTVAYLSGPVIASIFEVGDRRGPKIYPAALHEAVYMLVWELTPHEANKPRLPIGWRAEYRPWFYGQYSKNTDPAWLKSERERFHRKREEQSKQ